MGKTRTTWTLEDEIEFIQNLGKNKSKGERLKSLNSYKLALERRDNFGELNEDDIIMVLENEIKNERQRMTLE